MTPLINFLSGVFGYMFLALSILVSLETIFRKLFNFSFQGVDELGGYALAVGSSIAFSIALVERAHIRIDLLHERLPLAVRALLDWLSIVLLAAFGAFMVYICWTILSDTMVYGSTSQTPWATPLIYPQGVWYAALAVFAAIGLWMAIRATAMLLRRDYEGLERDFHPKGAIEELKDELEDLERR